MVIDSVNRKCEWVKNSLTLTADIVNGDNSGRLQGNKSMYLDYVGTFFNYKGQICRTKDCSDAEWDEIFKLLANPINRHTIPFPFGKKNLTQEVYISQVNWKLIDKPDDDEQVGSTIIRGYRWEKVLEVQFVAINSQWLAGGSISGLS